jgi:hypothetical protein
VLVCPFARNEELSRALLRQHPELVVVRIDTDSREQTPRCCDITGRFQALDAGMAGQASHEALSQQSNRSDDDYIHDRILFGIADNASNA